MYLSAMRLLALLLALLVPLQGMAAVVAGQCMALGHHDGHSVPSTDDQESHDHAAHSYAEGSADSAASDETDGKGPHCGPCTACCASASIAAHTSFTGLAERFTAPYVFAQLPPPSIQLDGLDRPPLPL